MMSPVTKPAAPPLMGMGMGVEMPMGAWSPNQIRTGETYFTGQTLYAQPQAMAYHQHAVPMTTGVAPMAYMEQQVAYVQQPMQMQIIEQPMQMQIIEQPMQIIEQVPIQIIEQPIAMSPPPPQPMPQQQPQQQQQQQDVRERVVEVEVLKEVPVERIVEVPVDR
jgi:hypothetical protein